MAFLGLYLSSVYGEEGRPGRERCVVHPFRAHDYLGNAAIDYAADMTVLLAHHDLMDAWIDDRNVLSLAGTRLLARARGRVARLHPRQYRETEARMARLSVYERVGEPNPDLPANCFGELLGEVFAMREDGLAGGLRAFGKALGRFVYVLDACVDLRRDLRRQRYNPLAATPSDSFGDILGLLMADCMEQHGKLPTLMDTPIIENILYSGVWTRFEAHRLKREEVGKR
jgi:hypothetical protein